MKKIKSIILAGIFIPLFICPARAEVITLKSGKVIEGEIIEKTKDYIKVKYNGREVYYENKYIKSIEAGQSGASSVITQKEEVPKDARIGQSDAPVEDTTFSFKKCLELAAAGNFSEARQEFERQLNDIKGGLGILDAVENNLITKEHATYLFQGSLEMINKNYKSATTSLEKAWEINPKDINVNYNLAFAYYTLKEYRKSAVYLYTVLKLQPDDVEAYELMAKVYYNLGEYQKSKEALLAARKLLERENNSAGVAEIDSYLGALPVS